jgi:hypothetical protein
MPWKLRKAPNRPLYWVVDDSGKKYSKDPLPLERAKAQMRALYANEGGAIATPDLVRVERSPNPKKKWRAFFDNGKHTDFGAAGMNDYTITKSKEAREQYVRRHIKDLKTGDPTRAGFLSLFLLWGPYTSLEKNIAFYKKKFNS